MIKEKGVRVYIVTVLVLLLFIPFTAIKDSPCINSIKELIEKNKAVAYNMFNKGAGR